MKILVQSDTRKFNASSWIVKLNCNQIVEFNGSYNNKLCGVYIYMVLGFCGYIFLACYVFMTGTMWNVLVFVFAINHGLNIFISAYHVLILLFMDYVLHLW